LFTAATTAKTKMTANTRIQRFQGRWRDRKEPGTMGLHPACNPRKSAASSSGNTIADMNTQYAPPPAKLTEGVRGERAPPQHRANALLTPRLVLSLRLQKLFPASRCLLDREPRDEIVVLRNTLRGEPHGARDEVRDFTTDTGRKLRVGALGVEGPVLSHFDGDAVPRPEELRPIVVVRLAKTHQQPAETPLSL
jgi:hypothetical protein